MILYLFCLSERTIRVTPHSKPLGTKACHDLQYTPTVKCFPGWKLCRISKHIYECGVKGRLFSEHIGDFCSYLHIERFNVLWQTAIKPIMT